MAEVGNLSVRLSLDNAQFERSVASMNKTLQAMGQELRGLQNRGSEWGNSLEGLRTRQEAYSRMLEAQQTKVQRLAELYETAKTEQGEYSNEAQNLAVQLNRANAEMTRTERELSEITAELQRQEDALVDTRTGWQRLQESAAAAGERMQEVGKKMTSIGKDLSMKVTAPIVAMGAAIVKVGADFEAQMSRVGAISGATGEELEKLKETAMELGATTSKSASEVAIGMENMAAMGFTVNEIMDAMPGIIAAAEASGADMAQTADVVATALNIWGLEAAEASRVSDILAEVANRSAADINDMQYALKYAGSPAAALGVSLEELSASIGIMSDAGLEGSQAGTSLRAGLLALLKPSEKNSKMMDVLGISVTDLEDNFIGMSGLIANITEATEGMTDTNKLATLAAIVGTEASSGFLTLIEAGPEKIDLFAESLENSAGASKKAADLMKDNLKGSLEELGGALETLAIQMFNLLVPTLKKVVEFVQVLVEKFSSLSPSTQKTILAFAGIAAVIGPLLVVAGILVSSIGSIVSAFGAVSLAIANAGGLMAVLGAAFTALTGPIALTIAAIAAVGIGVGLLVKHFKKSSIEIEEWEGKVSESTAKAVGSFLGLSDEASRHLNTLSMTGQVVTKEMAANITSTFAQMGQQVLAEMQADHGEQLAAISSFYANSGVLIESEEAEILAKTAEYQANKEKQISDGNARIAEIMNIASNEKRALTIVEEAEISHIHSKMKDNAIKYMTESELEQKVILESIKNNASEISAQQAAEVVRNSVKQKDEVVAEAQDQYSKAVAEIIKQRDEMGVISGQQAKQLIEDAGKQRDETIKAATEMHVGIVDEAKIQAGEHVAQVDWETGEIKSKWQVMKQNVSEKMKQMGADIKRDWSQAYSDAKKSVSDMATSVSDKFSEIGVSVSVKMSEAKESIVGIWNEALGFLTSIDLYQIGKDIIQGLIDGIGSMASYVWDKVTSIVDGIKGAITGKSGLDSHSPSRVTEGYGVDAGQGLIIGMDNMISKVAQASLRLTGAVKGAQVSLSSNANTHASNPSSSVTHGPTSNAYYITIDAKNVREFNDIVQLVQGIPQASRAT